MNLTNDSTLNAGYFNSQFIPMLRQRICGIVPTVANIARVAMASLPFFVLCSFPYVGADSSENNSSVVRSEPEGALSIAATFAQGILNSTALLGMLALQREQWHRNQLEVSRQSLEMEEDLDDFEIEEIEELTPFIEEKDNFDELKEGSVVVLAKQNHILDLFISFGQNFLNPGKWINATHAAIIAAPKNATAVEMYEIPNANTPLSRTQYNLQDLSYAEQLMVFDPSQILPQQEQDLFLRQFLSISETFVRTSNRTQPDGDAYNFRGLIKLPLQNQSSKRREDWILLLDRLWDYHILAEDGSISYAPKNTQYFCSEFVWQCVQLARFVQKYPAISERVRQQAAEIDFQSTGERRAALEEIYEEFHEIAESSEDPLFSFFFPSATPAKLIAFAESHGLPVKCIKNPESTPKLEEIPSRWISKHFLGNDFELEKVESFSCFLPEDIERSLHALETKMKDGKPILRDDPSVNCLINSLASATSYSKETLTCLVWDCFINSPEEIDSSCPANCIEQTYTWREKMKLVLTSVLIDRTLDRLIATGQLERFLDQARDIVMQYGEINVPVLIDILFSSEDIHFLEAFTDPAKGLNVAENYLARNYLHYFLTEEDLYKNFPVGLMGMESIFQMLGWQYSSPVARLGNFAYSYLQKELSQMALLRK